MNDGCCRKACLSLGLSALVYGGLVAAYPTGAPPRHTGAEGEPDCSSCHFGGLGDAPPRLELHGPGDTVPSGSRQALTFLIAHPDMVVAGIQVSIRPAAGSHSPPGRLDSDRLETTLEDGISYLNHKQPLQVEAGRFEFTVEWRVPDTGGTAVINAALVAGNDDQSPFGDSVVTLERSVEISVE